MSDYKNIDITVLQAKMDREAAIARALCATPITLGSQKQIDWAVDIRWRKAEAAAKVIRQIEDNKLDDPEMTAKQQKIIDFYKQTFANNSAKFWIDNDCTSFDAHWIQNRQAEIFK
jgi:hypothetical protein